MRPARACDVWTFGALILMYLNFTHGDFWFGLMWTCVAFINGVLLTIESLFALTARPYPEESAALARVLAFVEQWNKGDADREVAEAAAIVAARYGLDIQ